jgi:electron transfer DM13
VALAAGAAVLAAAAFVIFYFEPQKLVIDQRVDEAAPAAVAPSAEPEESPAAVAPRMTATPGAAPPGATTAPVAAGPRSLARGSFRSLEHSTTGEAIVAALADGSRTLRLEGFETSNGPDLRVYLSAGSNDAFFGREYGQDFVELGKLKGNIGNQNYTIPESVDLAQYRNAVIWCKRFSVGFGVATLK